MTLQETKQSFRIIGKITLPVLIVFMFSEFSTKLDRSATFKIQLNDTLLCSITPGINSVAHITVPHWKKGDTLKINQIGCGSGQALKYSFHLQNNVVAAEYYSKESELSAVPFVKITPDNLPIRYYKVYYEFPFTVAGFEPRYLFDLTFKEQ